MILGPDGKPAVARGLSLSCDVSGKRRSVELVKMNRLTCWVRVPGTMSRPAKIIKRHLLKHGVGA